MAFDPSGTQLMLDRQHGDRWASYGEHSGIESISELLLPDQLRAYEPFRELDDGFLREISPDVTVANWKKGATIFEEGTYLDVAFWVVSGEVEVFLARDAAGSRPIYKGSASEAPISADTVVANTWVHPRTGAGSITFLSSLDLNLSTGERARLGARELFGEIGALNGWPQSATVRTTAPTTLVQIRIAALRKLRRKSPGLKARLDELYRTRTLREHLQNTPLFEGLSADALESLWRKVELASYQPGEIVAREGDPAEHVILVRGGVLKQSQQMGDASLVLTYVSKGGTVGEMELLIDGLKSWQTTLESVGHSELVRIAREDALAAIHGNEALERRLWENAVGKIKAIGFARSDPRVSELTEFSLAKGLTQGNSVLVIDLETCTRCDDCVRGCANTHDGVPRFVREGEVFGGFMIARSCYHCEDPVCLIGCPTGAIRRANVGAVVEIDASLCIGCAACEQNCPYDSIVMRDLGETWGATAMPKYLRGQPRAAATKCDLCYKSAAGPACVSSCPHGSAARVSTVGAFHDLIARKRERGATR